MPIYFSTNQFTCKSGDCIDLQYLCDGIYHCKDQSDENKDICPRIQCPGFTYKCEYGACVGRDSKCNGIQDCVDYSDEINCTTSVSTISHQ